MESNIKMLHKTIVDLNLVSNGSTNCTNLTDKIISNRTTTITPHQSPDLLRPNENLNSFCNEHINSKENGNNYSHQSRKIPPSESNGQCGQQSYNVKPSVYLKDTEKSQNGSSYIIKTHYLDIKNVSYTVKERIGKWWKGLCFRKTREKAILNKLTFRVQSGEVTAILGNSGSGKTTILDIISKRETGTRTGEVTYCGEELSTSTFRKMAGYVIQADHNMANLTVEETLTYVAHLKFLENDAVNIKSRVDLAISQMGMRHLSNSIVGGVIERGLSGGEKRRLSIATQLIQDPALLLLDEPTTGLDSFTAHSIIQTLTNLAKNYNKIVLLSIHQPRSDIFNLFDKIALLSLGEMVYFGPRSELVPYFTETGYPCPTYANPLDHYVDVSSIDRRSEEDEKETIRKTSYLKESYRKSELYCNMLSYIDGNLTQVDKSKERARSPKSISGIHKYFKQAWILLMRLNVNIWRSKISMVARLSQMLFFAFIIWIFLFELTNDYTGIQDRTGLMFECISATPIMGLLNAIAMFPSIRDLYYRELGDGLYKATPFLTAYYIHILPFHVLSSGMYATWVYWGVGCYPDVERFFIFMFVIIVLQYSGELLAVLFLCICDKVSLAQSVNMLYFSVAVMASSGLLRTADGVLAPVQWLQYTTFYKYAAEIVVANEYHDLILDCSGQEGSSANCTISGDTYLDIYYPGAVDRISQNCGILAVFVVGLWIIDIIAYKIKGVRHLN